MHSRGRSVGRLFTLLCLLTGIPAFAAEAADAPPPRFVPGEVLVKYRSGVSEVDRERVRSRAGATRVRSLGRRVERVRLTHTKVADALRFYSQHPSVEIAEPNYYLSADATPDDPYFVNQWNLRNDGQSNGTPGADIDAEAAWDVTTGSKDVIVAVIDSGISYSSHPDLTGNIWVNPGEIPGNGIDDDGNGFVDDVNGWDFANGDADPLDDYGHGTHVSGIIGAIGENEFGIAGINWKVSLMPLKFLDASGLGTTADAIAAIEYAAAMGADVINASWGGTEPSALLQMAIDAAADSEVLFVCSAGNDVADNDVSPHYPSNFDSPTIVAVAATDRLDQLADFSNFGATSVDLGAPGEYIWSTSRGLGFAPYNGTSMAAPHVTGVAALVRSVAPNIRAHDLKQIILDCADPIPALAGITVTGGRLNAGCPLEDQDSEPPGGIDDLAVMGTTSSTAFLSWTSTGDDGDQGRASLYEVRFSSEPINAANFDQATPASRTPPPAAAGIPEGMELEGLAPATTYYIAMRVRDEWDNAGPISNVVNATTLAPPTASTSPGSFVVTIPFGGSAVESLTVENAGDGTLDWVILEVTLASGDGSVATPVTASPAAGRLPAGQAQQVALTFDATGIAPSLYSGALTVTTNDPKAGSIEHPVSFTVVSVPRIAVGVPTTLESYVEFTRVAEITNHAFEPTEMPAGGATIEVVVEGDFGASFETAEVWVEENLLGVIGQLGLDCIAGEQSFPIDPALLEEWTADGSVQVAVRNSSGVDVICEENSHTVRLQYFVEKEAIDFGRVYVGQTRTRSLTIGNNGSAPLTVTSIASDTEEAVPSIASAVVPPGETVDLDVTFSPGRPGDLAARLTIVSDDPAIPVATVDLTGAAENAPLLSVTPESIVASAFVRGDTTEIVTMTNVGGSALDYSLQITGGGGVPFAYAPPPYTGSIAPGESVDVAITLGDERLAPGLYTGTLEIHTNDPDTGQTNIPLSLTVEDAPNLGVFAEVVTLESSIDYTGYGASTIHTLDFPAKPAGPGAVTFGLEGDFSSSSEFLWVYIDGNLTTFAGYFGGADCTQLWDDYTITAGALEFFAADDRIEFELRNNSTVGYQCSRNNHSVRLDYPTEVDPRDFGTIYLGSPAALPVLLTNDGTADLSVTSIATDTPEFQPGSGAFDLAPGESRSFDVAFTPAATGVYSGVLTIQTNDPDRPVATVTLLAQVLEPPILDYSPASFTADLPVGVEEPRALTLTNSGNSPLAYSLEVSPAESILVQLGSTSGSVDPGGSVDIPVVLKTVGLFAGLHQVELLLTTDAPNAPMASLPVTVEVSGAPDIAIEGAPFAIEVTESFEESGATTDLALLVPEPPLGRAEMELVSTGDFRYSYETATWVVEGRDYGTLGNSGVSCGSVSTRTPISASELGALIVDGKIEATVQNSSNVSWYCDENSHTMRLISWPPVSQLDFGTLFAGDSAERTVDIANLGTDTLTVTSLSVDHPGFDPSDTSLVLAPGQIHTLGITFAPESPANVSATLTIASDDPDEGVVTLSLSGVAQAPPMISVNPASLAADLPVGTLESLFLTIGNPGDAVLDYAIEVQTISTGGDFVTVSTSSGSLGASESEQVEVVLDATNLVGGLHQAQLVVGSNDPVTPMTVIPVDLTTTGIPDIQLGADPRTLYSVQTFSTSGATTYHNFAIVGPVVGDATMRLVADGHYRYEDQTATINVEGVTLGTFGALGDNCPTVFADYRLPHAGLSSAIADGVVEVDVRNSPAVAPGCGNRHAIDLEYYVPTSSIEFGEVAVGESVARTLLIHNGGTDVLEVTSIVADSLDVSVDHASLSIPALSGIPVTLTFTAATPTPLDAVVTIHSDDPDTPVSDVRLAGQGQDPPLLSVTSFGLTPTIPSSQVAFGNLQISNLGEAPLEYTIGRREPDRESAFTVTSLGFSPGNVRCMVSGPEPGVAYVSLNGPFARYDATADRWDDLPRPPISTSTTCTLTELDGKIYAGSRLDRDLAVYDVAEQRWTKIPDPAGLGFEYLQSDGDSYLYVVTATSLRRFDPASGALLDLASPPSEASTVRGTGFLEDVLYFNDGNDLFAYDVATDSWTVLATIESPDYLTSQATIDPVHREYFVPAVSDGNELFRISLDTGEVTKVSNPYFPIDTTPLVWVTGPGQGIYFGQGTTGRAFGRLESGPTYLEAEPFSGSVEGGSTVDVQVRFDSAGLDAGVYDAGLLVQGNDPLGSSQELATRLTVIAAPEIALRGTTFVESSTKNFFNYNGRLTRHRFTPGSEPVADAVLTVAVTGRFGHEERQATVRVGGQFLGSVGYPPETDDCMTWTEEFLLSPTMLEYALDDDGSLLVDVLSETSASCPTNVHDLLLEYPRTLETLGYGTIYEGSTESRQFVIENKGSGTLEILSMTSPEPEFTADPPAGSIAPGESMTVTVWFQPSGTATHATTLEIQSNDPETPLVRVSLAAEGLDRPVIDVQPGSLEVALTTNEQQTRQLTISNLGGSDLSFSAAAYPDAATAGSVGADNYGAEELVSVSPETLCCLTGDQYTGDLYGVSRTSGHMFSYEPSSDVWTQLADSPFAAYYGGGSAMLGGTVYTIVANNYTTLGAYDIQTDTWTSLPHPLQFPTSGIASDGERYLYLMGGNQFVRYDPTDGTVVPLTKLFFDVSDSAALRYLEGRLYAYRGYPTTAFGEYDIEHDVWKVLPGPPNPASRGSAIDSVHRTFFLKRENGDTLYQYDIDAGFWSAISLSYGTTWGGMQWTIAPRTGVYWAQGLEGRGLGFTPTPLEPSEFVAVDPDQGVIPAGGQLDLEVALNAIDLVVSRSATIHITSNDPVTPEVGVPVALDVTAAADISVVYPLTTTSHEYVYSSGATTNHSLAVDPAVQGPVTVDLTIIGDFRYSYEYATLFAEGHEIGSLGEVGYCVARTESFEIDATIFQELAADGVVEFQVRNSSNVSNLSNCLDAHTVTLNIDTPVTEVDFGRVFLGQAAQLTLDVDNASPAPLVVSSVDASFPGVTAAPESFTILGKGRQLVTVTFTPTAVVELSGALTIASNDPNDPLIVLPLVGSAAEPPVASVDPNQLDLQLSEQAIEVHGIELGNSGGSDLEYLATVVDGASFLSFGSPAGSVPPGATVTLDLTVDVTTLPAGPYQGLIQIQTNDPNNPLIGVWVTATVHAGPDIGLLGDAVSEVSSRDYTEYAAITSHAFPAPGGPVADAVIRVIVEGEYRWSYERADIYLEGEFLESLSSSGLSCGVLSADFPVDAAQMAEIAEDGMIELEIRNSNSVSPYCPTNRHTVELGYSTFAEEIDFGAVLVGQSRSRSVQVLNNGSLPLQVTSFHPTIPDVTADPAGFALAPGARQLVALTLDATVPGQHAGTLGIASNDPDEPLFSVPMSSSVGHPPIVGVTPSSLAATLLEGQSDTRTLTVLNTGGTTLEFSIDLHVVPQGAQVSSPIESIGPAPTVEVEGVVMANATAESHASVFEPLPASPEPLKCVVGDPANRMIYAQAYNAERFYRYDAVRKLWERLADSPVTSTEACGAVLHGSVIYTAHAADTGLLGAYDTVDGSWSTMTMPTGPTANIASDGESLFLLEAQELFRFDPVSGAVTPLQSIYWQLRFGNVGGLAYFEDRLIAHSGDNNDWAQFFGVYDILSDTWEVFYVTHDVPLQGMTIDPVSRDAVLYGHDGLVMLFSLDDGSQRVARNPFPASSDHGGIAWLPGDGHAVYLVSGDGGTEFTRMITGASAISAIPITGEVPPDGSLDVGILIDGAKLPPGSYGLDVSVVSNDPVTPVVEVPASVIVVGAPDIHLPGEARMLSSTIDFEDTNLTEHLFELPAGLERATVEVDAVGNYGIPLENARVFAEGKLLGIVPPGGQPCATVSSSFTLYAHDLAILVADGQLEIVVENTEGVHDVCPANYHRVRLHYEDPLETLDFGQVFLGTTAHKPLTIANGGSVELHVGSIASDLPEFSVQSTTVAVPAGDQRVVELDYAPTTLGSHTGTLTILSDDPDEPAIEVAIQATVAEPPVAEVTPAFVTAAVPPGSDMVKRKTLQLSNTGGTDLTWSADIVRLFPPGPPPGRWTAASKGDESANGLGALGAETFVGPDAFGYVSMDSNDPHGPVFDWIDTAQSGTALAMTRDDQNSGPISIGFPFSYYGETFDTVNVSSNGWLSFTSNATAYGNPDSLPNDGVTVPENLLAVFWDDLHLRDRQAIRYLREPGRFIVEYDSVDRFETGSDLTFQVVLYDNGRIRFQYLDMVGVLDSATIGIQNGDRTAGLLSSVNEDFVTGGLAIEYFPTPDWATADRVYGVIPPGGQETIELSLDGAGLPQGDHASEFVIVTNDPFRSEITVPVVLHVHQVGLDVLDVTAIPKYGVVGQTVEVTLQPQDGLSAADIVSGSVLLWGQLPAQPSPVILQDPDGDGKPELVLQFDAAEFVQHAADQSARATITATGEIRDQAWFFAEKTLRVRSVPITTPEPGGGSGVTPMESRFGPADTAGGR